jgi:cellulose synthase/poly-beta-1,6-N-acetylglucosamine synthase-like glycosyltransferase
VSRPSVSAAICTYNGEAYLGAQLESIAAQTLVPDEVVLCDDRSTDRSVEIARQFAERAPMDVRVEVNESNLGSTANFARAISLCRGEIIALSDQDDVWLPHRLQETVDAFDDPRVGMVFGDAEVVSEDLTPTGTRLWECVFFSAGKRRKFRQGRELDVLLRHNVVTGACSAFRAEYRDLLLPIPAGWVHDGWAALLISAVAEVRMIPRPMILYRQHSSQQIGAAKMSLADMARLALRIDWDDFCGRDYENFLSACERLASTDRPLRDPAVLRRLDQKIRHAEARLHMHRGRMKRYPLALRELLLGRYLRYSSHWWRTLAVDLVL